MFSGSCFCGDYTSCDLIKYFAEQAGIIIHPSVVVEIALKWWSVRTDTEVSGQNARKRAWTKCQKIKNQTKCQRTKCQITRTLALILNHTLMVVGSLLSLSFSLHTLYLSTYTLSPYILSIYLSPFLSLSLCLTTELVA